MNTQIDFEDGGPIFTTFQVMIAESSAQKSVYYGFEKLHRFGIAAVQWVCGR